MHIKKLALWAVNCLLNNLIIDFRPIRRGDNMEIENKIKYCSVSALILFLVAAIGSGGVIKPFHWSNIFADILVLAVIIYVFPLFSAFFNAITKRIRKES